MLAWWPQCVYGQSPLCNAVTALSLPPFTAISERVKALKASGGNAAKAQGIVFSQNPTIAIFSATGLRRNGKRSRLTQELILPLPYTSRSFKKLIVAFPHPGPLNSTSTEVPLWASVPTEALTNAWGHMEWTGGFGGPREWYSGDCRHFPDSCEAL